MASRISYYGGIVTNGLVLNLDAAKLDSYPRTGTLWRDISGNNNNGTLINEPTFNSDNGGSIVFDEVNDYVDTNYTTPIGTNPFSYCVWFKFTQNQRGSLVSKRISSNFEQFSFFIAGDSSGNSFGAKLCINDYFAPSGRLIITTNNYNDGLWHYGVATRGSQQAFIYVDGLLQTSSPISIAPNLSNSSKLFIGVGGNGLNPFGLYFNGSISLSQIYNKQLSASEVLQNYNATKNRYL